MILLAGPLSPIKHELKSVLEWLHTDVGLTWAWSIIALTILVRLVILPVDIKQKRSMLAMQRLQPYVKQLQAKFKDDKQALNQALMEFYRANKVNPLASCLPIVIQIPIFISLFYTLKGLKKDVAPGDDFSFLFGAIDNILVNINDAGLIGLTLVVFYVASQMVSSYVMNTSPDPRQKYMFLVLPLVFIPFIINFPIGVMLYWITTNLWTFALHLTVVRVTDMSGKEIHLPDGKAVVPKGEKAQAANRGKASGGAAAKGSDTTTPKQPAQAARRNKRRR